MMPYIVILKIRKFHQSTINRFGTAGKKPVGGGAHCAPPSLNRVKTKELQSNNVEASDFAISQFRDFAN